MTSLSKESNLVAYFCSIYAWYTIACTDSPYFSKQYILSRGSRHIAFASIFIFLSVAVLNWARNLGSNYPWYVTGSTGSLCRRGIRLISTISLTLCWIFLFLFSFSCNNKWPLSIEACKLMFVCKRVCEYHASPTKCKNWIPEMLRSLFLNRIPTTSDAWLSKPGAEELVNIPFKDAFLLLYVDLLLVFLFIMCSLKTYI